MRLGFVGLGAMGRGMAANLRQAGFELAVFNRSSKKAEPLVAAGAVLAATPAEAADSDIVITMLADDQAVEDVVFGRFGIREGLSPGCIHVSMSTISVALAERLAAVHAEAGQIFVSAPVFGRPDAAAAAKLFIVAGGAAQALERCASAFDAIAQRTFKVSEHAPDANLVKLSGNFLIASVIEALGESMALIGKAGIDKKTFLDVLTNTLFSAPVYKTYGTLIAEQRYDPAGFRAELGYKDAKLALAAAAGLKVPMPVASVIADRFLTLIALGGKDLDWSALGALASRDAGEESGDLLT